jgi:hypothetical protein
MDGWQPVVSGSAWWWSPQELRRLHDIEVAAFELHACSAARPDVTSGLSAQRYYATSGHTR